MTTANGGPSSQAGPPSSAVGVDGSQPQVPLRADGIQLIGRSQGSGYREAPSLVRRADGQTLQLTPLLYAVLEAADGSRGVEEIADHASAVSGRLVSGDNVRTLIDSQLLPMGMLRLADGSQPEVKKSDPLLAMRFRYTVTDPERTRRITAPFAALFNPLIVVAVTAAFLAACWWVLMEKGLGSATHEAFENPALLLLIFLITLLSAGFHEFGHAAGARKGGATPGAMGVGLYLIWPAFYTDVTDSYRLGKAGRLRTDVGGLYFNAIIAVAIMGIWMATGFDALLLVVVTQILQMVRQLLPLVRFDGYHILADATGVPDLFQRIGPTLLGLLPWRRGNNEAGVLKPWVRAVVTLWVLVTVPLLLVTMTLMVISLPRLMGTAWASAAKQQSLLAESLSAGDLPGAAVRALAIAAVALPMAGIVYILLRVLKQLTTVTWRKTRGNVLRRGAAMAAIAAMLAGLAWAWWPDGGTYRPVQPYERGTLADVTTSVFPQSGGILGEGQSGSTVALWPAGTAMPTREQPQLSMVLIPTGSATTEAGAPSGLTSSEGGPAPSWVFPFDRPEGPQPDGNQALAVTTRDGSVTYSVAFALVWADDGEPVDARNEAYAFASCAGCAAVAVGFQVVLILGQADVVVPENLSAAANYNCFECLTYALASQLVITLDGPLSDAGQARLAALWAEIAEYGRNIRSVPLSDIQSRLAAYKEQIVAIVQADPSAARSGTSTSMGTASPGPNGGALPSGSTGPATAPAPAGTAPTGTAPATGLPSQPAPTAGSTTVPATPAPAETAVPGSQATSPVAEPLPSTPPG
ncbi:hypothetical protein F8G81_18500 [Arthrobacter sp. CDRTa11]|uniref:hypothetical protein n=1 Tax=Arthrobacter sp. CDRTa11 TaxID=2651199 RepID=UPI002265C860|nr:hypothetical protein [Arthrobacter sp. CDRTa11]UZX04378.1 hypothetical protein F8G81_18500 [Arthrobacter sp. CDRTa11]